MPNDKDEEFKAYREDTRIPCRYGAKCYQKSSTHHEKYKHPPSKDGKKRIVVKPKTINKKRKKADEGQIPGDSPKRKVLKEEDEESNKVSHEIVEKAAIENINKNSEEQKSESSDRTEDIEDTGKLITIVSLLKNNEINIEQDEILPSNAQVVVSGLFLTKMPEDFFQLYEFCKSISEKNPLNALKDIHVELVGPYDVFKKDFLNAKIKDKEALLRHWRYYYDPPEFQTIIKDNSKDGLHFGYWRDEPSENPIFVGKNKAVVNCVIEHVAENVLGALDVHIAEVLKLASPFERTRITQLQQNLKKFAKEKSITLEKKTTSMQNREKKVVARTFHKAGIVVPYNKKTQLGYRDLAVTDNELQKMLKQIDNSLTPESRKTPMAKLDEVIRLATIAADECDFGTVLELGHDLFSSGVSYVENKALSLFSLAYNLLQRPEFLKIAQAHLKNRKKSLNLSVIHFDQ